MGVLRKLFAPLLLAAMLSAQGCGGGGGGAAPSAAPAAWSTSTITIATAPNVQPISVNAGLANNVDLVFVSVTLCA